ncbi:MAG TPA: contact-dependent growth inhibition system immunity protein [Longimicrobium sp.]|nr:contact-dependent growth inhibition system immunity protein [Longimicrobium sp.]
MSAEADFPALHTCLAGYFHQDWDLDDPTWEAVVDHFARDAPDLVPPARRDLARLLAAPDGDVERILFDEIMCAFYPPGDGLSIREWLIRLDERLAAA